MFRLIVNGGQFVYCGISPEDQPQRLGGALFSPIHKPPTYIGSTATISCFISSMLSTVASNWVAGSRR
ncbi:hypothetical protein AOLI_G00213670 [Acnodon oligacanthus]